jgi:succinoglycan biosynthesis transport protein ExoP
VRDESREDDRQDHIAPTPAELLSLCWNIVRRQYMPALACLLIALPLGAAYLRLAPASYTASTLLLIDTRKGQFSPDRSVVGDTPIDTVWVETQLAILSSEGVLGTVVKDLRLDESPEFNSSLGRVRSTLASIGLPVGPPESLAPADAVQRAIGTLQRKLRVKRSGSSWIIEISVSCSNADLAARITNAVADAYVLGQREWKVEAARRASDWLQTRLRALGEQSSEAEKAVVQFKAKHNIVAVSDKLMTDQQLAELSTQLVTARADVSKAEARLDRIDSVVRTREPVDGVAPTVTDALNNPIITRLRTQYLELASREGDYAARFGANHGAVINLRKQLADLRLSMQSELDRIAESYKSEYLIAKARQDQVEKRVSDQITKSREVSEAEITLRQLESAARSYRTLHDMFLQRYSESQQSLQADEARVISPASPPSSPSNPKPLLVGVLTILGGLGAGVGFAFLRELLDNVFRTADSVSALIGVECLAMVPALKMERTLPFRLFTRRSDSRPVYPPILRGPPTRGGHVLPMRNDLSLIKFTEAMRALRLALATNKKTTGDKIIGVTSSVPGEGKSTIVASLARAVAQTGARTILIDADLRKPTLSRSLAPQAKLGLVDVIQGKGALDDAIWTDPDSKLDFIPHVGGTPTPPVIDVFPTKAAEHLFERLRVEYDYIFVDLCPLSPVVDVRSTTDLCDAYLFIVNWGHTKIEVAKRGLTTAPRVWGKLIGAVLNQADLRRIGRFDRSASAYDTEYMRIYQGDMELTPIGQLVSVGARKHQPETSHV